MEILIQYLQWAVKSGLISVGTAVLIGAFCILVYLNDKRRSEDFRLAQMNLQTAHTETCKVLQDQIDMQSEHIKKGEERYEILRIDLSNLQKHVAESNENVLREMLGELRSRR